MIVSRIATKNRLAELLIEFTTYDRPCRHASIPTMSRLQIRGALLFEPVPRGTLIRWSWALKPRGPVRLMTPIASSFGRSQEQAARTGLKRVLEEGSDQPQQPLQAAGPGFDDLVARALEARAVSERLSLEACWLRAEAAARREGRVYPLVAEVGGNGLAAPTRTDDATADEVWATRPTEGKARP